MSPIPLQLIHSLDPTPVYVRQKKAHAWALDNWVKDAQTRTDEYHNGVRRGPATWILTHEKNFPRDAIVVEEGRGETLYICRAYYDVRSLVNGETITTDGSLHRAESVCGSDPSSLQLRY